MKTFDDITLPRPALARSYLGLLQAQPGRPLALFAPRRVGKTYFLDTDLCAAAKKADLLPVYADLWLHKGAPLQAINHALEEALDDALVPGGAAGKLAHTPVRKIGALGAHLELGDEPRRRPLPEVPELRLDALMGRLTQASGNSVLLMLDEVQALGNVPNGQAILATLRAVLQKHKNFVQAVFTGSSQEALAAMMVATGAPMYQFAQLIDFPPLGDEFLQRLADHFQRVHPGKQLALADLQRVFEHIGFKPALMKDLVKSLSAEGQTNLDAALARFVKDDRQVFGWDTLMYGLPLIDQAVLIALAHGMAPLSADCLARLRTVRGLNPTIAKVRVALERLRKSGILSKPSQGAYVIEDRLFADHVAQRPWPKG